MSITRTTPSSRRIASDRNWSLALLIAAFTVASLVLVMGASGGDETGASSSRGGAVAAGADAEDMIRCLKSCSTTEFKAKYREKWHKHDEELMEALFNLSGDYPEYKIAYWNIGAAATEETVKSYLRKFTSSYDIVSKKYMAILTFINSVNAETFSYILANYVRVTYWASLPGANDQNIFPNPEEFTYNILERLVRQSKTDEKDRMLRIYSEFPKERTRAYCGRIRELVEINHNNVYGANIQSSRQKEEQIRLAREFVIQSEKIHVKLENLISPRADKVLWLDRSAVDQSQNHKILWYIANSHKVSVSWEPVGILTYLDERPIVVNPEEDISIVQERLSMMKLSSWALIAAQSGLRNEIMNCAGEQMTPNELIDMYERIIEYTNKYLKIFPSSNDREYQLHQEFVQHAASVIEWLRENFRDNLDAVISDKTLTMSKFKTEMHLMGAASFEIDESEISERDLLAVEESK